MVYAIKTEDFEGPLDLLLTLIENQKLDVCKISISLVTNDYLKIIANMKQSSEDVADFLVVASRLLYFKSKSLLPTTANEIEEEIDDLEQQLKEYQKFKQASKELEDILKKGKTVFAARGNQALPPVFKGPENVTIDDLLKILIDLISKLPENDRETRLEPKVSLQEKISLLRKMTAQKKKINLREIFRRSGTKTEIIVIFLAVLELVRTKEVGLIQKTNFGDLILKKL